MTDQPDLREEIAKLLEPHMDGPRGTADDDYRADENARDLADHILALPRIANALKLTVVKTMGEE